MASLVHYKARRHGGRTYCFLIQDSEMFHCVGQGRVVRRQGSPADVQGSLVELLGFIILLLFIVKSRQVIQGLGTVWVIWPQKPLPHLQGTLQKLLCRSGTNPQMP